MSQVAAGRRLQVCRANQLMSQPEVLTALRSAGWKVDTEECLDQCTRCHFCAFALVSGQFVFAPTPQAFLKAVTDSRKGRNRIAARGKKTGRGGSSHAQE